MYAYKVKYRDETGDHFANIEGVDPGNAFAKCQKLHPGALVLQAIRQHAKSGWKMVVDAPPIQRDAHREPRPAGPPKSSDRDGVMPFYDEVIGSRRA